MSILNLRGTVHGRTIKLEEDSGLEEGQEVDVSLQPRPPARGPGISSEEWLRLLRSLASDCGVSVSNEDLSSEGLYE